MSGNKRIMFFVFSNCDFIFMLFVEGNMVSALVCMLVVCKSIGLVGP